MGFSRCLTPLDADCRPVHSDSIAAGKVATLVIAFRALATVIQTTVIRKLESARCVGVAMLCWCR